ncbi:MAG: hypothetical protein ACO4CI_02790, partial [Phycisphaerales bacterium]
MRSARGPVVSAGCVAPADAGVPRGANHGGEEEGPKREGREEGRQDDEVREGVDEEVVEEVVEVRRVAEGSSNQGEARRLRRPVKGVHFRSVV